MILSQVTLLRRRFFVEEFSINVTMYRVKLDPGAFDSFGNATYHLTFVLILLVKIVTIYVVRVSIINETSLFIMFLSMRRHMKILKIHFGLISPFLLNLWINLLLYLVTSMKLKILMKKREELILPQIVSHVLMTLSITQLCYKLFPTDHNLHGGKKRMARPIFLKSLIETWLPCTGWFS